MFNLHCDLDLENYNLIFTHTHTHKAYDNVTSD